MECKMIGALEGGSNEVNQLDNLLMALSFARKRAVTQTELKFLSPSSQGIPGQVMILLHDRTPAAANTWQMKRLGPPKSKGRKQAKDVDVTCRQVTMATCSGSQEEVVEFWKGLGFKLSYVMAKAGNEYCCVSGGFDLCVLFTSVTIEHSGKTGDKGLLMEVSVQTSEELYGPAGDAVLAFSEKLRPLVHLSRANL